MNIDISKLTRAKGEDPFDSTFTVDETTIGGFSVDDRVRIVDPTDFVGDFPNDAHVIGSFLVSEGEVCAVFDGISKSGFADQSAPIKNLVLWRSQLH